MTRSWSTANATSPLTLPAPPNPPTPNVSVGSVASGPTWMPPESLVLCRHRMPGGDVRTYRTPWFGGTPWQKNAPIDVYWDNSPLKYVANATTPTILFVGQQDPRVPMPQSVEMYRALESNGVPTVLYVAPREPHGWGELRHQLFKMNAELGWFEKYVMGRDYTWEQAPEAGHTAGAGGSRP